MFTRRVIGWLLMGAFAPMGCFNPPPPPPPARLEKNQVELQLPYDLAWETVNAVIIKNDYHVSARDPNNGIVEAEVEHGEFTLKDADCGKVKGIAGGFSATPAEVASAVYTFYVKPQGTHTSLVTLTATFDAPIQVPFHPMKSVRCTSRGVQEARLLKQVQAQAAITHRASYETPEEAAKKLAAGEASEPQAIPAEESVRRRDETPPSGSPPGVGAAGPHLLDMPSLPSFPQAAPASLTGGNPPAPKPAQ